MNILILKIRVMLEKQFWKRKRRANNLKRRIIGTLSTF
jgi:hypothetical protein